SQNNGSQNEEQKDLKNNNVQDSQNSDSQNEEQKDLKNNNVQDSQNNDLQNEKQYNLRDLEKKHPKHFTMKRVFFFVIFLSIVECFFKYDIYCTSKSVDTIFFFILSTVLTRSISLFFSHGTNIRVESIMKFGFRKQCKCNEYKESKHGCRGQDKYKKCKKSNNECKEQDKCKKCNHELKYVFYELLIKNKQPDY
ncbi:5270_t:CDS:2, partial [Dentiscutata erythropus]